MAKLVSVAGLVIGSLVVLAACTSSTDFAASGAATTQPDSFWELLTPDRTASALPTILVPRVLPTSRGTPVYTPSPTVFIPTSTPYPDDPRFSIGKSLEERDIWAWQFGSGTYTIVLVGGIHGGFEGNTVILAEELIDYFRTHPNNVLPKVKLVIIPAANPDGLVRGSELEGRFNARGVDLNRNWGCEWSDTAVLRDVEINPGSRPFSEPESFALRAYFVAKPPDAVIFYHSAAGGIFLGECGDDLPAIWMGELLADATGYPHHNSWSYYEVSGDATNWLANRGIPAAVVETYTKEETDFEINLAGVIALECYFSMLGDNSEPLSEAPDEQTDRLCH